MTETLNNTIIIPFIEILEIVGVKIEGKKLTIDGDSWKGTHITVGHLFFGDTSLAWPVISISPEDIFTGKIDLLNIDFISGKNAEGQEITSAWSSIRTTISQWYKALRMFAIIGLLSALIYTGIKIILSSSARDKSKYKEWIVNWFIAVAILFSMHYIMSFVISATNELVKLIDGSTGSILITVEDTDIDIIGAITDLFTGSDIDLWADTHIITNYMGAIRFLANCNFLPYQLMYLVMYIALCVYTLKFLFVYIKRMISMAFLTLIAPIVALMYPIDKMNDGQAQAFNMWIKEYTFNALLQPMHLILYYILLGSSIELAVQNPIYAIVALAFMSEGERLLKKIFGFEKASGGTVGGLSGAFAAGAIASNIGGFLKRSGGKIGQAGSDVADVALDAPKPVDNDYKDYDFLPEGEAEDVDVAEDESGNNPEENPALKAYRNDGYGQNAAGHYFNPNTDEYDENYNPADDKLYKSKSQPEPQPEPVAIRTMAAEREAASEHEQQANARKEQSKFAKGMSAVGKRMLKPIWDTDKSGLYNGKRWARRIGKFALGTGVGLTAAAVQAGISITDGKYNPLEGIATMGAGYIGAGKLIGGVENLTNTYTQGALTGDQQGQMERYKSNFRDREDVIAFNKKNYPSDWADRIDREAENYVPKGFTDPKQMKSCMKYADKLIKNGMSVPDADKQAAATHDFIERVKGQGQQKALYNQDARDVYIETVTKDLPDSEKTTAKRKLERAFKAAIAFNEANR